MNPLGILSIIIALVVGYFGLNGTDLPLFGGGGPLATGPGRSSEVRNPQPVSRGGLVGGQTTGRDETQPRPGESPYKGYVRIITVQRSGDRPEDEHVIIRYGGGIFGAGRATGDRGLIDVTGWRIGSPRTSAMIPRVFNIPEIDSAEQDIFLPPGGEVAIVTGMPAYPRNFRENQCVGYFSQAHSFAPSLSSSCPDRPDRASLLARRFNGACIDVIQSFSSCRVPQGPFFAGILGQACVEYISQTFNYAGCVRNFRDRPDFLKSAWRVSLRLGTKLFDPRHDRVILRDQRGLLVDEFEY